MEGVRFSLVQMLSSLHYARRLAKRFSLLLFVSKRTGSSETGPSLSSILYHDLMIVLKIALRLHGSLLALLPPIQSNTSSLLLIGNVRNRWRNEFLKWSSISPSDIAIVSQISHFLPLRDGFCPCSSAIFTLFDIYNLIIDTY